MEILRKIMKVVLTIIKFIVTFIVVMLVVGGILGAIIGTATLAAALIVVVIAIIAGLVVAILDLLGLMNVEIDTSPGSDDEFGEFEQPLSVVASCPQAQAELNSLRNRMAALQAQLLDLQRKVNEWRKKIEAARRAMQLGLAIAATTGWWQPWVAIAGLAMAAAAKLTEIGLAMAAKSDVQALADTLNKLQQLQNALNRALMLVQQYCGLKPGNAVPVMDPQP